MKTLGGIVVVGLVVGCSLDADAGAEKVAIEIDAGCQVGDIRNKTVTRHEDDFLEWSLTSKCGREQDVLVCATEAGGSTIATPWLQCTGNPDSAPAIKSKIDAATNAGSATARVLCTVDWDVMGEPPTKKKFCVYVVNGNVGSAPTCPPSGTMCPKPTRGSELVLEVEP